MKISLENKLLIRKRFSELKTREDLLSLLNDAKVLMIGRECKPIQLKNLTYYANPELSKNRFISFTIKKKSGNERLINAPVKGLKSILRVLNFVLLCVFEPHKSATGFVLNKSIVDNAAAHVGKHYIYNIDLQDFFHSFDRNRVKMGFWLKPFNLNEKQEPLSFLLACLCTHPFEINGEIKTVLPQGSPTSPTITNILCKQLDRRLNGLAKRFHLTYTRYADDITFSSQHNIYNTEEFQTELQRIIEEDQNFSINQQKTRLQGLGYRQETTGLVVNEKVNVHRRYIKQLRMWISFWEKYGFQKAEQIFLKDYNLDKGHTKNRKSSMINVIDGKLEFLRMVKGEKDGTYVKLKNRFKKLNKDIPLIPADRKSAITGFKLPDLSKEDIIGIREMLKGVYKDPKELEEQVQLFTEIPGRNNNRPRDVEIQNQSEVLDLIFEIGLEDAMKTYKS